MRQDQKQVQVLGAPEDVMGDAVMQYGRMGPNWGLQGYHSWQTVSPRNQSPEACQDCLSCWALCVLKRTCKLDPNGARLNALAFQYCNSNGWGPQARGRGSGRSMCG